MYLELVDQTNWIHPPNNYFCFFHEGTFNCLLF